MLRFHLLLAAVLLSLLTGSGCLYRGASAPPIQHVPKPQIWGSRGARAGEFIAPRVIAISDDGFAYIADKSGRLHKWTVEGKYVASWVVPRRLKNAAEGPEGIALLPDGNIVFSNTHDSQVMIYNPQGKLLRTFGRYGTAPGCFLLVTGVCVDAKGFIYVADYGGPFDRISKWTAKGKLVATWSGHGEGNRQFRRPMGLAIARNGDLLVADVANHRIQRLDSTTGAYKSTLGTPGRGEGQLSYPYGVTVDKLGRIYTVEYNTHRMQQWTPKGKYIRSWGGPGHAPGQLANPWGVAVDKDLNIYIADTENNRIQKFRF